MVQYATKQEGGYLLYGSGFYIEQFDADKVVPIDSVPTEYKSMRVCLEGTRGYRALVNVNARWNGWLMPLVLKADAKKMLNDITCDEWMKWYEDNGNIYITIDGYTDILEPIRIEGKTYYDFGNLGWCFCSSLYDMMTYDELQTLTEEYGFVNVTMLDDLRICITLDYEDGCQIIECEDGLYNVNELLKYLEL